MESKTGRPCPGFQFIVCRLVCETAVSDSGCEPSLQVLQVNGAPCELRVVGSIIIFCHGGGLLNKRTMLLLFDWQKKTQIKGMRDDSLFSLKTEMQSTLNYCYYFILYFVVHRLFWKAAGTCVASNNSDNIFNQLCIWHLAGLFLARSWITQQAIFKHNEFSIMLRLWSNWQNQLPCLVLPLTQPEPKTGDSLKDFTWRMLTGRSTVSCEWELDVWELNWNARSPSLVGSS